MAAREMQERFLAFGTDASTSTSEELGRLLIEEVDKIAQIAKSVGAKAQ